MITVIVPHARPEFSRNILANIGRQRGVEARLLVVANGSAIGAIRSDERCTVITSEAHQSTAMNTGLDWLRAAGDGAWARFDDDDFYGPDYLAETVEALRAHPVVGKTWGFVLFDEGLFRFGGAEGGPSDCLTGGTLAAATANVEPFQRKLGEDLQWCRDMRASGVEVWATTHRNYCYDRRTERGGAPRLINSKPVATRWGFGGAAEFHGLVPPEYVNAPAPPQKLVAAPSESELFVEMCS